MERILLVGTEAVENAGAAMRNAAEGMKQAAVNIDASLERQQRFMDDWLQRFESVLREVAHADNH